MAETIQEDNMCYLFSAESLSATQQVIDLSKDVLHHSLVKHVNSVGSIVQSKEIKVAVFNHINTKAIIRRL